MKLVTSSQMRGLDSAAIDAHKIPSLELMERAGFGIFKEICKIYPRDRGGVVVVAGRGNNGGDGLVVARYLAQANYDISVVLLASPNDLSPNARVNWERLVAVTPHVLSVTNGVELRSHLPILMNASLVIDAILGTGLSKDVSGISAAAIDILNSIAADIVSIDLPSGLSSDTGLPHGRAVIAAETITLALPKIGLFLNDGPKYSGHVKVVDIGIPKSEVDAIESNFFLIEPDLFRANFKKRPRDSHKGLYGHVAIFAGSRGHLGAGYLASLSALRSGCGLVTYAIPDSAFVRFDARYAEIMCDPIPDRRLAHFHPDGCDAAIDILNGKSSLVMGPAIGTEKDTREFVNEVLKRSGIAAIVDADGLNVLDLATVKNRRADTILTPHPGEMARLIGKTIIEVQADRVNIASKLACDSGAIVILKGSNTVVAAPDGRVGINPTGNAGMATAGMGDALSGMIASFIAQGIDPFIASCAGVYLHGQAGDLAAAEHGERGLITSDVIRCIGSAIKSIEPGE